MDRVVTQGTCFETQSVLDEKITVALHNLETGVLYGLSVFLFKVHTKVNTYFDALTIHHEMAMVSLLLQLLLL